MQPNRLYLQQWEKLRELRHHHPQRQHPVLFTYQFSKLKETKQMKINSATSKRLRLGLAVLSLSSAATMFHPRALRAGEYVVLTCSQVGCPTNGSSYCAQWTDPGSGDLITCKGPLKN